MAMDDVGPSHPAPRRRVLLAFEGGGAKGLVHLGALHAIEDSDRLDIVGYAGTSAGAMVASLAAAGYKAEDLFALASGPDGRPVRRSILDIINEMPAGEPGTRRAPLTSAAALFGRDGWRSLAIFRRLYGSFGLCAAGAAAATAGAGLLAWSLGLRPEPAAIAMAAVLLDTLRLRLLEEGVRLTPVRDAFDIALRHAPRMQGRTPARADGRVCFADLPSLKICASNLTDHRLEVFSNETSPDTAIADAVCASICFPFAFRPWEIEHPHGGTARRLFLDGGLLSNLPAWCFDEERRLDPGALTIAVAIDSDPPRPVSQGSWLGAMVGTALFGAQVLSTRGAGQIEILRLNTKVDVFDFDIAWEAARAVVEQQRDVARIRLDAQVLGLPDLVRDLTATLRARLSGWLADRSDAFDDPAQPVWLRVSFAVPEDHIAGGFSLAPRGSRSVRSLTSRFGAGFDDCADAGLVIPVEGSTVGRAWSTGEPELKILDTFDDAFLGLNNAHRRARVPPGLAWLLAVPVKLPALSEVQITSPVAAVLVIDSCNRLSADPTHRARFAEELGNLISKDILPIFER